MRHLVLAALILIVAAVPARAGLDEGLAAWDRGDFETALNEFPPLAEQGDAIAQYHLGIMYELGLGVPEDQAEAMSWYLEAAKGLTPLAEQGDARAQYSLGVMYERGLGVPEDQVLAVNFYREAAKGLTPLAEQGDAWAQYNLGIMYERGAGVPEDQVLAVKLYREVAKQGNTRVLSHLATMYSLGRGVPIDFVRAHMFFNIAAMMGNEVGVMGRDLHAKAMTPEQIAEAQRLAREWMAAFEKRKEN